MTPPSESKGMQEADQKADRMEAFIIMLTQQMNELKQEHARRAEEQTKELKGVLQSAVMAVREEAQQYTREACASVRTELMEEVETRHRAVNVRMDTVMGEMAMLRRSVEDRSIPDSWRQSVASEPLPMRSWEPAGHAPVTPPTAASPPQSLASWNLSPPASPRAGTTRHEHRASGRRLRKPAEYTGKVAWESYAVHFEMMADAEGWHGAERALQLASALRGPAMEVLGHLTPAQRSSYSTVTAALQRKFGHQHQAEVYRARLKKREWKRGENLSQFAQDIEELVRRAYPDMPEQLVTVLARDNFVDNLRDRQMQIHIKQAHPEDLTVALARALEFEAFTETSDRKQDVSAKKARISKPRASGSKSPRPFRGECWGCGEKGHIRFRCPERRRTRSLDRGAGHRSCRECGKVSPKPSPCRKPKEAVPAGNADRLEKGADRQPPQTSGPRTE